MFLESQYSTVSNESQEEKEKDPLKRSLQVLTVRKININKLSNAYKEEYIDEKEPYPLAALAKFIIERHNTKLREKEEKREVFMQYKIDSDKLATIATLGYTVSPFICSNVTASTLSYVLTTLTEDAPVMSCNVSHILFFHREMSNGGEMFALCGGTGGYAPIQEYSDYYFPRQIAYRLLDPEATFKQSTKQISGNVISAVQILRSKAIYDPFELEKFYSNFTTYVRKDASIYHISAFRTKTKNKIPAHRIAVQVQEGGVRIQKRISLETYFKLLDHFSKISRGESTFMASENDPVPGFIGAEEKDAKEDFSFLSYYMPISYGTKCELDKMVVQNICNENEPHPWELHHPKLEDYHQASKYRLRYKKEKRNYFQIKIWSDGRMAFSELLATLKGGKFDGFLKDNSLDLENALNEIYLGFNKWSKWYDEKIVNCLSGELEKDSKVYFKLNGKWYETSEELHKRINEEFKTCVRECLIESDEEGFLPHPWEPHNTMTVSRLAKDLNISEKDLRDNYLNSQVSYLDSNGRVLHSKLEGEILLVPEINYFKKEIDAILQDSPYVTENILSSRIGPEFAKTILKELTEQRNVAKIKKNHDKAKKDDKETDDKEKKDKRLVTVQNPFFPAGLGFMEMDESQMDIWRKAEVASHWRMKEGLYNETYLFDAKNVDGNRQPFAITDKSGWLVGDRICPDGLEIFDILHYTEDKVFLYHVKEGFGASTRDAGSQLQDSCAAILKTSMSNHPSNKIFEEFYDKSSSDTIQDGKDHSYRERVKEQMIQFKKDNFSKLFTNPARKRVFVYAFLDDNADHHVIQKKRIKLEHFTIEDFKCAGKLNKAKVFKDLVSQGYLNEDGTRGPNYNELNKITKLVFSKDTWNRANWKPQVWHILTGDLSFYGSMIGRMVVLHTRRIVEDYNKKYSNKGNCEFKICQIRRASIESPDPAVSIWGHEHLQKHACDMAQASTSAKIKSEASQ